MSYSFSVWLDKQTEIALNELCSTEDRKRGAMVRVLIRRAYAEFKEANQKKPPGDKNE